MKNNEEEEISENGELPPWSDLKFCFLENWKLTPQSSLIQA